MFFVEDFLKNLKKKNINFFTGVPDSVLKNFSLYLDTYKKSKHIISTNEGSAIGIATGYHLSTKKVAAVYLQNSGLGNAINPLVSITHPKIYSIPILLIIGWRGSPFVGKKDESQHVVQGAITLKMLKLLNIRTCILRNKKNFKALNNLINYAKKNNRPVACLIENKKLILKKRAKKISFHSNGLKRYYVLEKVLKKVKNKTRIVSTTGYTSRELYQIRKENKLTKSKDFYMVGGMGHSSMVALGAALQSKNEILCIDGDGAILMHLGALGLCGNFAYSNFKHIILNNNAHESVGGQRTISNKINFKNLAYNFGYKNYFYSEKNSSFDENLKRFLRSKGPSMFEVKIKIGTIKNLERPKNLSKIKESFKS